MWRRLWLKNVSVDFSIFEISGVFCNEEWWIMDIGVSEYGIYPEKIPNSWSFQCWPTLHDFVSPTKMQNQITGPFMPCTYQNPGLTKQLVGFLEKAYKNIMMKSAFKYQGFWFIVFVESNSETIPHQIIKIWQLWCLWDHQDGAPAPNMVRNTLLIGRFRYVRGMVIPPLMGFLTMAM